MSDNIDYQLTRTVNSSYGIGISNAAPRVTGANVPKIRVTNAYTTDLWVAGNVQTPLRLTQGLTTTSGDLVLSSASGTIDLNGSTITNYSSSIQSMLDLSFQSSAPSDPSASTLRVYADSTGRLNWKTSTGVTAILSVASLTSNRVFALPNVSTTLVGTGATQTLTNKTIDTAGPNTIQVGGTNITSLVSQAVLTSSSPSFVSETLTSQLTLNTGAFHPIIVNQSGTTTGNDILFQKSGVDIFSVGTDETANETYTWTVAARDYKIGTNNTERLRIPSAGIANDNTITNILGLQSTTLVYKSNVADTSTAQTLTNKTINTAGPNTIQIGGTNITTLLGQAVLTSSSPTFLALSTTNGTNQFNSKVTTYRGTTTTTDGSTVTLFTIPTSSNTVTFLYLVLNAYCTAGANNNLACGQRMLIKVVNVAGTLTSTVINNVFSNPFATGFGAAVSGTNILVQIIGIASNTIRWSAYGQVMIE